MSGGGAMGPGARSEERGHAAVGPGAIDPAALVARVEVPGAGAVVTFAGNVRDHHEGRAVVEIEYHAALPLAAHKLSDLVDETLARFDVHRVAARHRTGLVRVGEASVLVAVSASHRDEAFRAARHLIDRVKEVLPVWKRERFADGEAEWVPGACVPAGDRAAAPAHPGSAPC